MVTDGLLTQLVTQHVGTQTAVWGQIQSHNFHVQNRQDLYEGSEKRPHRRSVCFAPLLFVPRYKKPSPRFGLKVYPNVLSLTIYPSLPLPLSLSLSLSLNPSLDRSFPSLPCFFPLFLSLSLCLCLIYIEPVQAPEVHTVI